MSGSAAPEGTLVQYLLGRLPEHERLELEERLLEDGDLDQELLATTDDLIHAYLRGTLSEEDRAAFETHVLASARNREHLALMRDLLTAMERVSRDEIDTARAASRAPGPGSRRSVLAVSAIVLFALLAAVLTATRWTRQGQQGAAAIPAPTVSPAPPAETPASPVPQVSERVDIPVVRLMGKPGRRRVKVPLPPSARDVLFQVAVDGESLGFDAVIQAADGRVVWHDDELAAPAAGATLALKVPTSKLPSGPYTLRVQGERLRGSRAPVLEYHLDVVVTASPR